MPRMDTTTLTLPPEGRRIAFVGKGGSGKSTVIAHLMKHWAAAGIPVTAMDADEPGDDEDGSLTAWADALDAADPPGDLGGPIYPAPNRAKVRDEAKRLTPAGGLLVIDTGAWIRRAGSLHFAVLSAVDLVCLTLPPTRMELDRAGSVLGALEHLEEVGAHCPRLVIALTMVNTSASSADSMAQDLAGGGYQVLGARVPRSDAKDGYAQAFGRLPRLMPGSPMDLLAAELAAEAAK